MQKKKKSSKKNINTIKEPSASEIVQRTFCKNPDATEDDVYEALKIKNKTISKNTLKMQRARVLNIMSFLDDLGKLKK